MCWHQANKTSSLKCTTEVAITNMKEKNYKINVLSDRAVFMFKGRKENERETEK